MPPPSGSVIAFAIAAAASRLLESYPLVRVPCHTQLLRRRTSDLVWSAETGVKVSVFFAFGSHLLTSLDDPVNHNSGWRFSRSRELMVRIHARLRNARTDTANGGTADTTTVKVPQMAESITEGTLKQWSKRESPGAGCTRDDC